MNILQPYGPLWNQRNYDEKLFHMINKGLIKAKHLIIDPEVIQQCHADGRSTKTVS